MRGIWRHVREYRTSLITLGVLGVISALANGFVPYVTGRFFDTLIALSHGDVAGTAGMPYWALFLAAWAVVRILNDSVDWWSDRKRRWLDTNVQLGIQAEGFIHLLRLPLSFHTNEHIHSVLSRISGASWRVTSIIESLTDIAPQILSILIGIALAYSISVPLANVLTLGVLTYAFALILLLRGTAKTDTIAHRSWNDRWDDAASAVEQVSAVKQASADTHETVRIRKTLRGEVVDLWYRNELTWNRVNLWQRITVLLTQLTMFVLSVQYVMTGALTVGELVALNGYALMFFGPLVSLGYRWQVFQNGITSAGILERVFQKEEERYIPEDARTEGDHSGRVEFEDVTFRYTDAQEPILSHLSFVTEPGQSVAFVGESGVGKSTIISLISGYYFPGEGRVRVDGIDTRQWDLLALRSRIAVVPQEVALFNDTIRANIRYGTFEASDENVEQAARDAHIHDFIMSQSEGYDTLVGERGIKLSVGQKQRIAIARAILRNPEILILDEPTSALDVETEQFVTASLEKLMRGRTTFIVAHRLSTVRAADQILVIKDGNIIEQGAHKELLSKKDGAYHRLYKLHIGLYD